MAWNTPTTQAAGNTLTAAIWNAQVRDNFKAIGDAWTSYGSGSSWTASTSNPSLGNGTWAGAFTQAGKLVRFRISITMGSTTTYGTGTWRLALPVTPINRRWSFYGDAFDTGTAERIVRGIWTGSFLDLYTPATTAGNGDRSLTSSVPQTWATGDVLSIDGAYEAA